jgi:ATP-binding cassette, subfamily D (ALD), member 3
VALVIVCWKQDFVFRLSDKHAFDFMYVSRGFTFYKMANLDNRIANADQLLTQDVEKLSNSIGELYSNLSKVSIP